MTKPGSSRLPYGLRHPIKTYENRKWSSDTKRRETVRGRLPSVALEDIDEEARAAERGEAHKQNGRLKYALNDAQAHKKYLDTRSRDPFRNDIEPALLNSAHIAEYVAKTGMIFPFKPGNLKSASYEMPLRGAYVFIDKDGNRQEGVLEDDDEIVIPSNSITFLTVEPFFRLPDYIALRHNLKINHIYKGLLVGTGPLIDPGFVGRISLPLHNLTNNEYTLRTGDGIIWVEFTKLSRIPDPTRTASAATGRYVPFDTARTKNKLVADYVRSAVKSAPFPASSTAAAELRVDKMEGRIATVTTYGAITIIGLISVLIGLFLTLPLGSVQRDNDQQEREIVKLRDEVDQLRELLPPSSGTSTSVPSPNAPPSPATTP